MDGERQALNKKASSVEDKRVCLVEEDSELGIKVSGRFTRLSLSFTWSRNRGSGRLIRSRQQRLSRRPGVCRGRSGLRKRRTRVRGRMWSTVRRGRMD